MIKPIDLMPGFSPRREETKEGENWRVTVQAPPFMNQPPRSVLLSQDQFRRYREWREKGLLIQEALPELTPRQREILMSGLDDLADI